MRKMASIICALLLQAALATGEIRSIDITVFGMD